MSLENNVKHLWDCALSLDVETHSKKLLKSNLINVCRKIAGTKENIPLERFAASQMCVHCSTHWHENDFQLKLKPQTIDVKTGKAKKLIAKLKAQQNDKSTRLLTKKQKKRAKWLLKRSESKVEIKCEFCQHKTLVPLDKPSKKTKSEKQTAQNVIETADTAAPVVKSKKKKKNKDTNAGLKIPKNTKSVKNNATQESRKKNAFQDAAAVASKSVKIKDPPPAAKSKPKNPVKKQPLKIQSKTQKQNSLLQLAALLKSQDKSKTSGSNSAKNRLESLLE